MSGADMPLRPGNVFRVGRSFPKRRLDEDRIDFLRVHYETDAPGLGRVVEVLDDGMVFDLWGHRFLTPMRADQIRPLSGPALLFARERLGEAILRREIEAGKVASHGGRKSSSQPLIRLWLHITRGPLPILKALGGRVHLPIIRKAKARLRRQLAELGMMPPQYGFLDHGMLVDRIGVDVELVYSSGRRMFWLDRILLHKNHSLHLIGIDLDIGEQRTFRLDKVRCMSIPGKGKINKGELYWELWSLCSSGITRPRIGGLGRPLSKLAKLFSTTMTMAKAVASAPRKAWSGVKWAWIFAKDYVLRRKRRPRQEINIPSKNTSRGGALSAETPTWRCRILKAVEVAGSGGYEQVTCLLPMNAVLKADPIRCRAYLRRLMELTLEEAKTDPMGHPMAVEVLTEALAISRDLSGLIPASERLDARMLLVRVWNLQPGWKRIWVHAGRRNVPDARLLLCENYLSAVYHVWGANHPVREEPVAGPPKQWFFYRTGCHFISRWDNLRFRVDATSVPKLRAIVEWWDGPASRQPRDVAGAPT